MATLLTDEEIFNVCCCIRFMIMTVEDGYSAKALDYLKQQEVYGSAKMDERFLKTILSTERKYLKALKRLKSPTPTKYLKS